MKTLFNTLVIKTITVLLILISCSSLSYSQNYPWGPLQKITSGYNDRNPAFGTKQQSFYTVFDWEFMVFERHQDSTSNICILKMGIDGPVDSVIHITDGTGINTNPSISYYGNPNTFHSTILKSIAVWESEINGRRDIYAAYFNSNSGWEAPFPVDTSGFDKSHPQTVFIDSMNFGITYEKNSDIIFKVINGQTRDVSYDTNFTSEEKAICTNPFICLERDVYVSYQKQKIDGDFEIDFRKSNNLPNWFPVDTIAYTGNNINNGFMGTVYYPTIVSVFSSDRLGNSNIYGTALNFFEGQKPIEVDSNSENYDYESYVNPVVTDGGFFSYCNAYISKTDSIRILLINYFLQRDTVTVSDSDAEISLTMNRGMAFGQQDVLIWVVFNKDSPGNSKLYGKSLIVVISDIRQISSNVPERLELYQNYPNPFNPVTKIKFDIPQMIGNNASDVKLIIYDQLGRKVESLLDKQLGSGTYEVTWDAGRYSSGIYFYKLVSGNFSETKKLMFLK